MPTPPPTSSTPRRAPYQRTSTGLYVSELAHPLVVGRRLRLSATTPHELKQMRAVLDGWRREYSLSLLRPDEFRSRIARLGRAKAPTPGCREAWTSYADAATPSVRLKFARIWPRQIAPEFAQRTIHEVTPRSLAAWEARHIADGYAPTTTSVAFSYLAAAVRASLGEDDEVPWRTGRDRYWRPSRAAVAKELPACGTAREAVLLIQAALDEDRARRAGAYGSAYATYLHDLAQRCTVALLCGLRNGEIGGLGWDDFFALDGDRPRVRIRHQAIDRWRREHPTWTRPLAPPKGKRDREVLLHPAVVLALDAQRELLEQRGWYCPDGPVFPSPERTLYAGTWRNNHQAINAVHMKRLAAKAGLPCAPAWVTHSLRHSLATLESTSGADLRSVQKRTGHGSLRVLETYIHARTGRDLAPSAIPALAVRFDLAERDTDPCLPPVDDDGEAGPTPETLDPQPERTPM